MKPFIQLHVGQYTNLKPFCRKSALYFLRRSIAEINFKPDVPTKLKFSVYKPRNISTCVKLHTNNIRYNEIKSNSESLNSNNDMDEFPDLEGFRDKCNKQEEVLFSHLQTEKNIGDEMTNQKWDTLKSSVLKMYGTINEKNIDAIIMSKCSELKSLPLGKSYFKYLKSKQITINRATYGNYLRLFNTCASDCNSDDFEEILAVYKELSEVYPILDSQTAEKAILALCLTENWKEYEKLFIAIKQFYNPTVNTYRVVIQTAFNKLEFEVGWKLMEEMQYHGIHVPDDIFLVWFQKVKFRKREDDISRVLNFFNYFNVKPSDGVCKYIKDAFEEYNHEGKAEITRITRSGVCRCCNSKLESCQVSQEDFDELRKAFLNPVVIGKDIFLKTKPEEFSGFLGFLKKSAPFDVVVDGLNVALCGSNRTVNHNTIRLKAVVKFFANHNAKVLVLGRKHMASWNTPAMEYIHKNAQLFLTDNLTQDDPFMLYAALYSGLGTCFVSRDMMRGHKFLLANPKLQITFQKWQSLYQYFLLNIFSDGRVFFQEPVSFLQTIQKNSKGDWHVPYTLVGEELTDRDRVDHLHRHWLCMQKKTAQRPNSSVITSPSFKFTLEKVREFEKPTNKIVGNERPTKKSSRRITITELFKEDKL